MSARTRALITADSNKTITLSIPAEIDESLEERLLRWLENEFQAQREKICSRADFVTRENSGVMPYTKAFRSILSTILMQNLGTSCEQIYAKSNSTRPA